MAGAAIGTATTGMPAEEEDDDGVAVTVTGTAAAVLPILAFDATSCTMP
jgi:hypothetical protein